MGSQPAFFQTLENGKIFSRRALRAHRKSYKSVLAGAHRTLSDALGHTVRRKSQCASLAQATVMNVKWEHCAEEVQLSSLREARARATIWDSIRVVLALMHSLGKKMSVFEPIMGANPG